MIGETSRSVALGIFLLFGNFASGFSPQKWQHPPKSSNKSVPSPPTSGVLKITPSPFFGSPFLPSPPPNPNKNTPPWNWWNLPQTVSPNFSPWKKKHRKTEEPTPDRCTQQSPILEGWWSVGPRWREFISKRTPGTNMFPPVVWQNRVGYLLTMFC